MANVTNAVEILPNISTACINTAHERYRQTTDRQTDRRQTDGR